MIFDILFLPLVFFIGLITSYEDIRFGKVKNKWILLGLGWGLAVIILSLLWDLIASPVTRFFSETFPVFTVSPIYLSKVVLNAVIALVIAFLMWRFNTWAAGDAKLFFVYSLLIPLKYYWKAYLPVFPSFALLINIFIPIFLYLLFRACFHYAKFIYFRLFKPTKFDLLKKKPSSKKKTERRNKFWESVKNMGVMMLGFITIFMVFGLFQQPIKDCTSIDIFPLLMFIFVGLIIFSGPLSKLFQKPLTLKIILLVLIIVLSYGFISSPESTWQIFSQIVKMMIIFIAALTLFRKLIDFYVNQTGLKEINIEDLKPNMNLAEETLNKLKEDKDYYDKHIGFIYSCGLTNQQVQIVKKWGRNKLKKISIYQPFPFVGWMFFGVIITLILKSSFLHPFLDSFFNLIK
jgi:hypothetical protein